jgi:hypothetical protein
MSLTAATAYNAREHSLTSFRSLHLLLRAVGMEKMKEKVVVLRELQRAIIYTRELNRQAIEGHVSTAFIVYSVIKGGRLTRAIVLY